MRVQHLLQHLDRDQQPAYLTAPFPCPLDDTIATLLLIHRLATVEERRALRRLIDAHHSVALLRYAERMAQLGARGRDRARLDEALHALVVEDLDTDARRSVTLLDHLHATYARLGFDPRAAFERAATLATPHFAELCDAFARLDR